MGLATARRLAELGYRVDVYESSEQLGGLTTWYKFGEFDWDKFYHVILPSDRHLIRFIGDIGLADELRWRQTRTGFYVDGKMHSISTNLEFLRFPLLSLFDKVRLAWTMVYSSRIRDWRRLEDVSVEDWLRKVSGNRTYEKMWRPLLLAKLGENYRRVSAVFIWSYIKRLFSARDSSASKEHLGHVAGGYKRIFDTLVSQIEAAGGNVSCGTEVSSIQPAKNGGLDVQIAGEAIPKHYEKVICTSPVPVLQRLVSPDLLQVTDSAADVEYLGVVCVVLVTTTPTVPYYVVNIADDKVPFTGIIGMSNVVSTEFTDDQYLTYLPKYVLSTDQWLSRSDDEIREEFLAGLRRMLPSFDESAITGLYVNRATRVQPLQVQGFSRIVPTVETTHPDFFVLNTAQFLNATLNNNEVIRAVDEFVHYQGGSFESAQATK
jgi:protoporphyrinogen oxidase